MDSEGIHDIKGPSITHCFTYALITLYIALLSF